jgi:hypothetical protein
MKISNNLPQMLPSFYLPLRGRKPRSAKHFAGKIASLKQKSFKQIREIFDRFIPEEYLKPALSGDLSRQSIFSRKILSGLFRASFECGWRL